jgi:translation initiation factor 6
MLERLSVPHIGVLCKASEKFCIVPKELKPKIVAVIKRVLSVEIISTTICHTSLIGAFVALNSRGAIVTDFAYDTELRKLRKNILVATTSEKLNAIGNNVLLNDTHCLVHPDLSKQTVKIIESTLSVKVAKGTIAGFKTVGSVGIVTNKGLLLHPKTTEKELEFLQDFFGLPAYLGTVNFGFPYVGAGMIANSKGVLVGKETTGIELGRIEEALLASPEN